MKLRIAAALTMKAILIFFVVLASVAAGGSSSSVPVKATGMAARLESMAQKMIPEEKLKRAMGFFGPVTKKYLPVFNRFQREYAAATEKMPVIVRYVPEAEKAFAEAKAMKVPPKYENEKAEYIKMARIFVSALKLSLMIDSNCR